MLVYPRRAFLFSAPATTAIYTLSLHDALPIFLGFGCAGAAANDQLARSGRLEGPQHRAQGVGLGDTRLVIRGRGGDRKSTRLNSSHGYISYAVFCLKKKKINPLPTSCYIAAVS